MTRIEIRIDGVTLARAVRPHPFDVATMCGHAAAMASQRARDSGTVIAGAEASVLIQRSCLSVVRTERVAVDTRDACRDVARACLSMALRALKEVGL